jgi:uncharacterized protein
MSGIASSTPATAITLTDLRMFFSLARELRVRRTSHKVSPSGTTARFHAAHHHFFRRKEKPALDEFLARAGFAKDALVEANEAVEPNYEEVEGRNGNLRSVQVGHVARQSITVNTGDIAKIVAASRAVVQFQAEGHPVSYGAPQFLVSNLEDVKMSLIGAAMQNSKLRATEFAKNGGVEVGAMRSASQGAFYILPAGANSDVSDWGGTYDKTTVDKIARVVVTVDYGVK